MRKTNRAAVEVSSCKQEHDCADRYITDTGSSIRQTLLVAKQVRGSACWFSIISCKYRI